MAKKKSFADALNEQIANEFAAPSSTSAIAVHYDAETLPRLAGFFYRQALEERDHAMMMVQYLLDADERGRDPRRRRAADRASATSSRRSRSRSTQEKRVGRADQRAVRARPRVEDYSRRAVHAVVHQGAGRGGRDDADLLTSVERSKDNLLLVEDFLAREAPGEGGEDDAPPAAGGA